MAPGRAVTEAMLPNYVLQQTGATNRWVVRQALGIVT